MLRRGQPQAGRLLLCPETFPERPRSCRRKQKGARSSQSDSSLYRLAWPGSALAQRLDPGCTPAHPSLSGGNGALPTCLHKKGLWDLGGGPGPRKPGFKFPLGCRISPGGRVWNWQRHSLNISLALKALLGLLEVGSSLTALESNHKDYTAGP